MSNITHSGLYRHIWKTDDNKSIIAISSEYEERFSQFLMLYPQLRPEVEQQRSDDDIVSIWSTTQDINTFFDWL